MEFIKLLRPSHYTKNLFLFLPLFFAGKLYELETLWKVGLGVLCFSLMASVVYILNDIQDVELDRSHPEKSKRPIASGKISVAWARITAIILFLGTSALAWWLLPEFLLVLGIYFIMNLLYSFKLKQISVVDITIIAVGFLLRVIAGGLLAQVEVSHWILIMTFLLALFLGLAKRRDDVLIYLDSGKRMRKALEGYNLEFINSSMVLMAGVVIVAYIMYTISPEVIERTGAENLYITSVFVILGIMRYLQITFVQNKSGNPVKILLKDLVLQAILVGWVLAFFLILYVENI